MNSVEAAPPPQSWDHKSDVTCLFICGFWGSNSGPCAYKVSSLPASYFLPCLRSIPVEFSQELIFSESFSEELCSIFCIRKPRLRELASEVPSRRRCRREPTTTQRPWDTGWSSLGRRAEPEGVACDPAQFSCLQVDLLWRRVLMRALQSSSRASALLQDRAASEGF